MKFLTQIKASDVVTIHHGVIQAIKGPIAYITFDERFLKHSFALDAKMFVAALRKLNDSFNVFHNAATNKIILADDKQLVDFIRQPAETLLNMKDMLWHARPDFVKSWNIAQKFVATDFPGIRIKSGYLEVLSDNSIVRFETNTTGIEGIFAATKLPANITNISLHKNRLWFSSGGLDFIVINHLDLELPNTDSYFKSWPENFEDIPTKLKDRYVETGKTEFYSGGVRFVQEEKATAAIENISGVGTYDGKLFGHVVAYGDRYSFQNRFVAFEADNIKGVVARVD